MRPGMPPGRKHFRRSRDAPISEKDLLAVLVLRILSFQRADFTLDRNVLPVNLLDGSQPAWDSRALKGLTFPSFNSSTMQGLARFSAKERNF
jgi:hypothetical protein